MTLGPGLRRGDGVRGDTMFNKILIANRGAERPRAAASQHDVRRAAPSDLAAE